MRRTFLYVLAVCFVAPVFAPVCKAEAEEAYVFNYAAPLWTRPANLYRLTEYADKDICVSVLNKLNEPYSSEPVPQNSYFGLFTNNSATLPWQERTAHSNNPIYFLQADLDGNGVKEWVYKAYTPVSGKYLSFITIEKAALGDSNKSDYDIQTEMYKHDITSYDKKFHHGIPQSTNLRDSETSLMKIGQSESLVVLNGESNPDRFCKGPYEVFAFLANKKTEEMPLPFCRFITTKNIQCKFPR